MVVGIYSASKPKGIHLTEANILIQYTDGYARPPRTVDPRSIAGTWHRVHLPYAPHPKILPGQADDVSTTPTQTTWYHFRLPAGARPPAEAYLYIPRWKTDGEIAIYVDGTLHYQSHANLQWNGSNQPLWIAFDDTAGGTPPHDIVVRLRHVRGIGGALSSLWVGSYAEVGPAYMVRNFFQAQLPYIGSAAFLASGIFALFVWFGRRRETLYLLFFTMTVITFVRTMHNYMGQDRLPISDAWFGWLTVNSFMWMIANVHLFLVRIHLHRQPLLTWTVAIIAAFFAIATLPLMAGSRDATLVAPLMYPAMFVIGNLVCLNGLYWSWRARSLEGCALATWAVLGALLGGYDWMLQNNFVNIENIFLSVYAQIATTVAFSHIILNRYTAAVSEVERANIVLAERLAAREAELLASHQKHREVERRDLLHQERQRLMQDMHDGLGSSLITALRVVEHGELNEIAIAELLKSCIDDLKLTIDSMEPVETDLLLLLGTLRFRLQPRLEATNISLRWEVTEAPPLAWLDQRHSLHILRIMQEAFTNVIKHADASEIRVATRVMDGDVMISVTDNGRGFDPALASRGRGLHNQAHRAAAIGGRVDVRSGHTGVKFTLFLPVFQASSPSSPAYTDIPAKDQMPGTIGSLDVSAH
ncbi:Probable two-component sensor histidine kinase [hydrothermal vent metagenome]|uniref:Probable two-component sensor histidine kinase n=1 Tax=hydrothermal vent metagenome TaxID=652676 RepID=A0A160TIW4_9ZZZZ